MVYKLPIFWLKPKNDFVFKFVFGRGTKQSNKLLLALLNDVFNVPKGLSLGIVEITNPLTFQTNVTDQYAILDIRAKVAGFAHVNLEMQRVNQRNIDKRTLYYGAKLFEEQLDKGNEYRDLKKVVTINFLDFSYFTTDMYHSCYRLMEKRTFEPYPDLLQLHFIEMPKFVRQDKENLIHPNDRMAKWIRFLTNEDDARWEEMANQDPIIENAVDMLRTVSMDREARMLAEAREKALKDINSIRGEAMREGKEEGIEEGIKKGIEKGRKEGIKEGIKEGKREIAKKMLMEGADINFIVKMTELTESEVLEMKSELN
ncbi:Rpn family recombination-promoting nuclease/putative transposase [Caldifermentibacillus hisashii]|uniref:Rpn family recombination-promoting nuclease/putative transposase n=1 Tax=Caldifermentibacillus hisashii TaxID=996558 RepID=UPI0031FC892A